MSESIVSPAVARPRRGWLMFGTIGFSLVILAMVTIGLVMLDKPHFGWMVGTWFLEIISAGMMVGSLVLIVGTLFLAERWTWRGITLLLWGLVGITSPAFGLMFLLPWGVLALSSPLIVVILRTLFRARRPSPR